MMLTNPAHLATFTIDITISLCPRARSGYLDTVQIMRAYLNTVKILGRMSPWH